MAALDGDFLRRPFGRVLELIPLAEHVQKLNSVCTSCYGTASFTKRTVASTEVQLIGGNESYQPVCRRCFAASSASAAVMSEAATPTKAMLMTELLPQAGPGGGSPGFMQDI